MRARADLAVIERMANLRAERRAAAQAEERSLEDHLGQTVLLGALRGDRIDAPAPGRGERRKPYRRLDGIAWLAKKGRLSGPQEGAAGRYGDDWRRANYDVLPSGLNFSIGGGDSDGPQEARRRALARLQKARQQGLCGHSGMIELCDTVCGRGLQLGEIAAEGVRDADRLEGRLATALDLLAAFYRG